MPTHVLIFSQQWWCKRTNLLNNEWTHHCIHHYIHFQPSRSQIYFLRINGGHPHEWLIILCKFDVSLGSWCTGAPCDVAVNGCGEGQAKGSCRRTKGGEWWTWVYLYRGTGGVRTESSAVKSRRKAVTSSSRLPMRRERERLEDVKIWRRPDTRRHRRRQVYQFRPQN